VLAPCRSPPGSARGAHAAARLGQRSATNTAACRSPAEAALPRSSEVFSLSFFSPIQAQRIGCSKRQLAVAHGHLCFNGSVPVAVLLGFSGLGRSSNRLLQPSLQLLFSSAHVDCHSPWLPAVFFPVPPSPPWAQSSLRLWQWTTAAPSSHCHALPRRFSLQGVNERWTGGV